MEEKVIGLYNNLLDFYHFYLEGYIFFLKIFSFFISIALIVFILVIFSRRREGAKEGLLSSILIQTFLGPVG